MSDTVLIAVTEDELDVLVSIAIRRAEVLDDADSPEAIHAWREVMVYEERLSEMTAAAEVPGGVARVGAVRAALAAGECVRANELAQKYLSEESLPTERRQAIERALDEYRKELANGDWGRIMTPTNSNLEERKYRLEVAKVLLDEWKWRHQHCWKLLTRGVVIAITVGLAPYAWLLKEGENFLKTYSGVWVLMFPVISLIIVHIALILFAGEYVRCRPSLAKYNEVMEQYSPNPMERLPTNWRISVAQQTIMFTGVASVLLALGDAYVLTFAAGTRVNTSSISSNFWLISIAGITVAFLFDYWLMSWTRKNVANRIVGGADESSLSQLPSGPGHVESRSADNKVRA